MFFTISKVLWNSVDPGHIIVWCSLLAAILLLAGRRKAGSAFAVLTALLLFGIGVMPSYQWLGRSLESRFEGQKLPPHADGILVLAGGPEDIHRLPAAYMLARRYPDARVVFSGGSGRLVDNRPFVDAERARRFLSGLGLDPSRLTLEGRSRNTYESFVADKALLKPRPGQTWILVTSAYHMPRSMEIARKLGWNFIPWPSDRLTDPKHFSGWFDISENIKAFDMLLRERIGLVAYRWSGRSVGGNHPDAVGSAGTRAVLP